MIIFRGQLLKDLIRSGNEVIALAPDADTSTSQALKQLGVNHINIPLSRTGTNAISDLTTFVALRSILRRYRPEVVLSYTVKPVIYASLAARSLGIEKVFSIITGLGYAFIDDEKQLGFKRTVIRGIVNYLYRTALRTNKRVMFQNPDDRDLFIKRKIVDIEKCRVINGSGVDIDHFAESPIEPHTYPIFLLIARLISDKGIREYVTAARMIKTRYPETIFWLVGPPDPNPTAIHVDEVEAWHQEGIIEYLGETEDVRPFLEAASVYVLPSYREGTPRTVLEAMSIGRAIITTDVPGCRETVVEARNGFLVLPRDPVSLAGAMERFIEDPHLIFIMGNQSRQIAVEKYDVNKVNREIMGIMEIYR